MSFYIKEVVHMLDINEFFTLKYSIKWKKSDLSKKPILTFSIYGSGVENSIYSTTYVTGLKTFLSEHINVDDEGVRYIFEEILRIKAQFTG